MESTNWSLSSFVKPDPKPIEKLLPKSDTFVNIMNATDVNETPVSKMRTSNSSFFPSHDQHKLEKIGMYDRIYFQKINFFDALKKSEKTSQDSVFYKIVQNI